MDTGKIKLKILIVKNALTIIIQNIMVIVLAKSVPLVEYNFSFILYTVKLNAFF